MIPGFYDSSLYNFLRDFPHSYQRAQKFHFSTLLLLFSFYCIHPERWYFLLTWFPLHWYLVMLSTISIYNDHFSVFYEEMSIEAFYTFFKVIYLHVVLSKLSCSSCLYILDIGPYSDKKFADILILQVAFLLCWLMRRPSFNHLVILEFWQRSFGHTYVNLFEIPFLLFIGLCLFCCL